MLVFSRSNRDASIFGAKVRVRPPSGWQLGSFEAAATNARLDVVAQFGRADNTHTLRHTLVLPGLTLRRVRVGARRPDGRRSVTYEVLDAGDKVSGARVRSGGVSGRTNASGRVTLVVRSLRATASKSGYTSASV